MEDEIFFNQSKYIKEMLKKFGLEDSKPTKTPMSTEIKLTKDDEADSVDSTKYRGVLEGPKRSLLLRVVIPVSVEVIQSNPSPLFCLVFISPLKGFSGLSVCARERVIGAG
ncbi:hypothetical protein Tco_1392494 [Tanacetum coccineum]